MKLLTVPESKQHDFLDTALSMSQDPKLERFQMYKIALQVYKAVKGEEKLPLEAKQFLNENRRFKQKIYHLVFETMHCKFLWSVKC